MSSSRLAKLRKQPDSTWALLQKRLIGLPDSFEKLLPPNVWNFIINKSHSLRTNPGYVSASLIATTSFIGGSASTLVTTTQEMPLNIYSIFVGPPTTGKSQAIKECAVSPMTAVVTETDSSSSVIQKCTSSGLVKTFADNKKGFLMAGEICDVLLKLLKSDEEQASYRYATAQTRARFQQTHLSPYYVLHKLRLRTPCHAHGPGTRSY